MVIETVTSLDTVRVRPTQDGTYTVYRGAAVLVSGLTRAQAELYEASIIQQARKAAEAPSSPSLH